MRCYPLTWLLLTCLGCSGPVPPTPPAESPANHPATEDRAARIEAIGQELIRLFNVDEGAEAHVPAFQERMMAVAGERVGDACGREALLWVLCHGHVSPAAREVAGRAADLLIAHHLTHPDMRFACDPIAGLDDRAEERLRVILAGSPDDATRGAALLALGDMLIARGNVTPSAPDREKLHREAITCLEEVGQKYADFRLRERGGRNGDRADRLLDQVRRLGVGCPAAELEGQTLDGKDLRLSDYRGRVVLLVFGKAACPGCVTFYPRQRALQQQMSGRPFAIAGVHGGEEKNKAGIRDILAEHQVTWPVVWSMGPTGQRPIETRWRVDGYPSIYLIDADGVIRFKSLGAPEGTALEETVVTLVKDAEARAAPPN